ncbi:MAG: hypothetical protein A2505_08195 [Deltaproteobacteria bacterium RIFOXYD12_FULL_55_16]|nr:MAG: hypothetical protein A2505_08195 [Deltaproteobacteria bacterium RIFOXYD12_FULL_55_16]
MNKLKSTFFLLTAPKLAALRAWPPVIAFFAGFLWDALTLGRSVASFDLWILSGYLAGAAGILWWLGHRRHILTVRASEGVTQTTVDSPASFLSPWLERAPFLLLQFLFGGLFSSLFILYFKSSSHLAAVLWSLGLGGLLVANEFLDDKYHRFTLTWALFGLCAMLLFNFLLPYLAGSINMIWFYLSTFAGAGLTHWLRRRTPGCPGRAAPVWIIAAMLAVAYPLDLIPPVPLVKRDIQVGRNFAHKGTEFRLTLEKAPWWVFWRELSSEVHLAPGERLYCVSAVFAPRGLNTRLYHRWEHYEAGRGWLTTSRPGFGLAGGRDGGFRGYTYKQDMTAGEWKVRVETENGRTIAEHGFTVVTDTPPEPDRVVVRSL